MATTGRPRGRPAKPTEVKRALGNPGHRPLPAEPAPGEALEPALDVPTPPDLGRDGLELWETVWTAGSMWLSREGDYAVIKLLCQAQDEAEHLRRALAIGEVPRIYVHSNGSIVTHPYVGQLKELRQQITAWLSSLGFSPADRARLGLSEVRQGDALDELTKRRQERLAELNEGIS